jgi:hypothetical protein
MGGVFPVHIAQRDDILAGHFLEIAPALSAHADAGDIEFLAGRLVPRPAQRAAGDDLATEGRRTYGT